MTISRRHLLASLLLLRHRQKRQQHRRFWVHPVNAIRQKQGDYHQLFQQLKQHEDLFAKASKTNIVTACKILVSHSLRCIFEHHPVKITSGFKCFVYQLTLSQRHKYTGWPH